MTSRQGKHHSRDGRNGRGRRAGVADRCVRAVSNARKGDRYDHVIRHPPTTTCRRHTATTANAGHQRKRALESLTKVNDIASDLGPGDSVLLEYGSEFNDQYLHIKDTAGNADAPIAISAYGDADEGKPVIASNGVKGSQWEQDYRCQRRQPQEQRAPSQPRCYSRTCRTSPSPTWRSPTTTRTSTIRRHVEVDRHP